MLGVAHVHVCMDVFSPSRWAVSSDATYLILISYQVIYMNIEYMYKHVYVYIHISPIFSVRVYILCLRLSICGVYRTSLVPTTSVAPLWKAIQISSTDASKLVEKP